MKRVIFFLLLSIFFNVNAQNYITAGDTNLNFYYDILPDRLMQTFEYGEIDSCSIDINSDGQIDLKFKLENWGPGGPLGWVEDYLELIPNEHCNIGLKRVDTTFNFLYSCDSVSVANLYSYGDTIDSLTVFTNKVSYIYKHLAIYPNSAILTDWIDIDTVMYIPIKIDEKFGWVKVLPYSGYNSHDYQLTIFDFAFNEDSNNNSVDKIPKNSVEFFPIPSTGKVSIRCKSPISYNASLKVFDINGSEIIGKSKINSLTIIEIQKSGVYFILLQNENSIIRQKIIISN
ncbi:MAG: T9SS type A sorting domain-containing protein [Bacteroidales bacterium]|nr:T9SS type A sorting domain-containing protein [Bacteroidales bacterium]